jgi:enoyl-[acyl-carrier protein] reductase II
MHSFADNRVIQHTGTEFPIFQAPIGLISRAELVGAVSAAGGVGLMETASLAMPQMQEQFDLIRARSNRPFGLHLMIPVLAHRPEREKEVLDWVLDGRTHFVTTGYGDPTRYIARLKDVGVVTYHQTDSLDEALRAQDAGVDGIVLGGAEKGGGHSRDELHTFALLQKARRRIDVPIVATGGIADGYGMAAAFALGAEAVQMGTRFVASAESPVHDRYKQAIVDAEATGTWVLNTRSTPCIRALKSQRTRAIHDAGLMPADSFAGIRQVYFDGDMEAAPALAGQSAGLIHAVLPVRQIVDDMVAEFHAIGARLGALAAARTFG